MVIKGLKNVNALFASFLKQYTGSYCVSDAIAITNRKYKISFQVNMGSILCHNVN